MAFSDQDKKDLRTSARAAIAYECQASNPNEDPGWQGSIYKLVKTLIAESFAADGSYYKGDGVYNRFTETTYEQVNKVCEERGLGEPPEA